MQPLAPDARADRACPACGTAGRRVERITVKAMLLPAALARLTEEDHRFCATAECPVVYFGASDRFEVGEIGVGVFQKEPPGTRTVCYCFAIGEADLARELTAGARPTAIERISRLVAAGRCACEVKNPQGTCCLGNVASALGSLEKEDAEPQARLEAPGRMASG